MKSSEYWKKRSEQLATRQFRRADGYEAEVRKEYDRAIAAIQREIEAFYGRYADNNKVSFAEARRLLTAGELRDFRMTLEEFTAKAKDNADGRWTRELNNVYYKTRISRLEALQVQIDQQVELLMGKRQSGTVKLLGEAYTDTYYRTMYELQRGVGVGASFARIDPEGLDKVLGARLDGRNWSQRIWDDRTKLRQELHTKLSQAFIRGESVDRTSRDLAKRMDVSFSRARTLIHTETTFFTEQATMSSYQRSGIVDRYEILATMDRRTSPICRSMDRKVFLLSEQEPGVTAPPFHPNCRTTTIPYFEDEINVGERIARRADGETYNVPGDISYEEWHEKYVVNNNNQSSGRGGSGQIKYEASKTVKDAAEFAKANLGFDTVDFSGLDLGSVNAINRAMADIMSRYPGIKGFAREFRAVPDNTFVAQASLDYRGGKLNAGLKVSSHYYKTSSLDDIINASVDAKHWPVGSNRESIFIHEFGHLLEYAHAVKDLGSWTGKPISVDTVQVIFGRLNSGSLSKEIKLKALSNLGLRNTPAVIKDELSGYAVTNPKEFLAEAFAEAEAVSNPRPLAKETVQLLREKLKEVGLL